MLDVPGHKVRTYYVVYHPRVPYYWFTHLFKQGFRHVELARALPYGPNVDDVAWLHLLPTFETLDFDIASDNRPPWVRCPQSTVQKVTVIAPLGKVRQWFHIGPISCTEAVKWALNINSFWVRTPWQLFRYIEKRNGVIRGE